MITVKSGILGDQLCLERYEDYIEVCALHGAAPARFLALKELESESFRISWASIKGIQNLPYAMRLLRHRPWRRPFDRPGRCKPVQLTHLLHQLRFLSSPIRWLPEINATLRQESRLLDPQWISIMLVAVQ